jgi:hypothetical protein
MRQPASVRASTYVARHHQATESPARSVRVCSTPWQTARSPVDLDLHVASDQLNRGIPAVEPGLQPGRIDPAPHQRRRQVGDARTWRVAGGDGRRILRVMGLL